MSCSHGRTWEPPVPQRTPDISKGLADSFAVVRTLGEDLAMHTQILAFGNHEH